VGPSPTSTQRMKRGENNTLEAELTLGRIEDDPDVQRLRQIAEESGFDHVSRPLAGELRRLLEGRSS
jgi:hypothetical protein